MTSPGGWVVWGSELSPYALKVMRLLRQAGLPVRMLPAEGGWLENWPCLLRVERIKRRRLPLTYPKLTEDDELPLVPYLLGPRGENLYDSSAIAEWLDDNTAPAKHCIPADPAAAFIARLVDDYADEFLLYVVHHHRWVVSRDDNDAGARLAREYRLGPLKPPFARWFSRRQTARLPYLFSTPQTQALLEDAALRLYDILEALLATRPFILGGQFTLADAAVYGMLGMNLADPSANERLRARAPRLHDWLLQLHGREPAPIANAGPLRIDEALEPLLAEISRVHIPLMRQNAAAHARLKAEGRSLFNERAFDRGEAMYDGVLDGRPFRHVAKSFQARSWRDCMARWKTLSPEAKLAVGALMPGAEASFS